MNSKLSSLPKHKVQDWSELKALADKILHLANNIMPNPVIPVFVTVENIVGQEFCHPIEFNEPTHLIDLILSFFNSLPNNPNF